MNSLLSHIIKFGTVVIIGAAMLILWSRFDVDEGGFSQGVVPQKEAIVFKSTGKIDWGEKGADYFSVQGIDSDDATSGQFISAKARVARVQFWRVKSETFTLRIRCRQSCEASHIVPLLLSVNGRHVGRLRLKRDWETFSVSIPAKLTLSGRNILTLETPKGTTKPDMYYDLDWMDFGADHNEANQRPAWRELTPGTAVMTYHFLFPGDSILLQCGKNSPGYSAVSITGDNVREKEYFLGRRLWFEETSIEYELQGGAGASLYPSAARCLVYADDEHAGDAFRFKIGQKNSRKAPGESLALYSEFANETPQADIIVLVLDSLRADAAGCGGCSLKITPNIDKAARKGLTVFQSIAAAPFTTSSIASLMTGVQPVRHKVYDIESMVPEALPTLAEELKKAGYETCAINAMATLAGEYGFSRGFQIYHEIHDQFPHPVDGIHAVEAFEKIYGKSGFEFPGFFYIHLREPHFPYLPPSPYIDLFGKAGTYRYLMDRRVFRRIKKFERILSPDELKGMRMLYNAGVRYADYCLGEILKTVIEKKRWTDTLLIILGDHGEGFCEHGRYSHGSVVYNEMTRVPTIISGGCINDQQKDRIISSMGTTDLHRLILDRAGINYVETGVKPGESENRLHHSHGMSRYGQHSLCRNNWKFIGSYKQFYDFELYNLEQDPNEHENLSEGYPILVEYFHNIMDIKLYEDFSRPVKRKRILSKGHHKKLKALGYLSED